MCGSCFAPPAPPLAWLNRPCPLSVRQESTPACLRVSRLPSPMSWPPPGYLAGGGDWEQLTELLLRGHGWHNVSTIDQHTALASPDGRLHVVHGRRAGWTWNLRATGPAGHQWEALLGAYLPVEYVSALVDAMRQPPTANRRQRVGHCPAAGGGLAPGRYWPRLDSGVTGRPGPHHRTTRTRPHARTVACPVHGQRFLLVDGRLKPPHLARCRHGVHPQSRPRRSATADGHRNAAVRLRAPHPPGPDSARVGRRAGTARSPDHRRPHQADHRIGERCA